ncbi:hypothetical protein D7Y06_04675 [Roseburia sp. 1XD42-69]|nr:hypothetical protein D7Y06_04675 [Roseburia sp. 1XD42-69]
MYRKKYNCSKSSIMKKMYEKIAYIFFLFVQIVRKIWDETVSKLYKVTINKNTLEKINHLYSS